MTTKLAIFFVKRGVSSASSFFLPTNRVIFQLPFAHILANESWNLQELSAPVYQYSPKQELKKLSLSCLRTSRVVCFTTGKKPDEQTDKAKKLRPESRPESLEDAVLDLLKDISH